MTQHTRSPILRTSFALDAGELVIDNFAGGGGASTGIEAAIGRPVDMAINHSPEAIAMHAANHPHTRHFCENIWEVDPREACGSRPVGLAWFSPDCTHFSRAKGGRPVKKEIRALAWVVIRWAKAVAPRVIVLENVEEFQDWGPLLADERPDPDQVGATFREWLSELTACGYEVEFKSLIAADYGTPTTRKRLFLVARRDQNACAWPTPSHGVGRQPWRPAAEIIDWSLSCPSIFGRKKPLAEATMRRIAAGVRRYVIDAGEPFIIPLTHQGVDRAFLSKHYGGMVGHGMRRPIGTVTAKDHHALTTAFLTKFYNTNVGSSLEAPVPTITAKAGGGHLGEVRAFLLKYYGADEHGQQLVGPLHTVTTKDRFGLVLVHGEPYVIADIGMRMLQPHELFAAQGFPSEYEIAPEYNGKPLTKTAQTALAGNSVCPQVARAIVEANVIRKAA